MESNGNIEERLTALENEVAELKRNTEQPKPIGDWPHRLLGHMKEFPEWEEISRLGKEIGNSQGDDTD